jgi:hypothetical protein
VLFGQKEAAMTTVRTRRMGAVLAVVAATLAGCGVPRDAGRLAATQATVSTMPADDAGVRAALLEQDAAWQSLAGMLKKRELGGITGVDGRFSELVGRATAFAARQRELIDQGRDDPAQNRATLESFRALWQQTSRYLNP